MTHGIWCSILLIWVSSAQAAGQQHCVHPQTPWGCVGNVEIRSDRDGKSERRRMVVFNNGEMLAEVEKGGPAARVLVVKPSGVKLYQGIADLAAVEAPQSPFMFFNEAIGWGAFLPLHKAYPSGPDSIPEGAADKTFEMEKSHVVLHTRRIDRNRIEFRYQPFPNAFVEGTWDRQPLDPLPDDLALTDWKYKGGVAFQHLRDARSTSSPSTAK